MNKAAKIIPMPPADPEAEQSVMGALLVRPEVMDQVADLLESEDFYRETHSRIYQAMLDLYRRGEPVDLVTVTALLKERGQLERVGGPVFLAGLSEQVGFATNAQHYAKIVQKKSLLRRLLAFSQEMSAVCLDSGSNLPDLLDFGESKLAEIRGAFKGNGFRETEGAILEIANFLETSIPTRKVYLQPWIWEAFIAMVSAWRGVGKTAFAMGLLNAISRGESFGLWETMAAVPCLYFDAEMTMQDTFERVRGIYSEMAARENFFIYSDHLSNSLGMPAANLLDGKWRAWLKDEVLLRRGVKLWVLDNIGAVTSGLDENSREAWSPINRWLLDLRFAGVATIFIHHEGKGGEQRGTSAREDNLDISISLKRPKDYQPEDGARFICHFEKARIREKDLHLISDVEFMLDTGPDGRAVWTHTNMKQENRLRVLEMLDQGISRKEIAQTLGITGPRVSQIRAQALKDCLITEKGKLTQSGFEYLENG